MWQKISKTLGVPVEEIYQTDESLYFICKDNAQGNYQGTNHIYSVPEFLLENQQKYIAKLEEENRLLKAEIDKLQSI